MSEQDTLYNVIRDGMHMTVYGSELKETDVIKGLADVYEQDNSEQLLNGIYGSKSEKTPEIARHDGVLNISDVLDSRERLEIDVKYHAEGEQPDRPEYTDLRWVHVPVDTVLSWLDRQKAITAASFDCNACADSMSWRISDMQAKVDKLTAERDELEAERNRLQRVVKIQAESFKALEIELAKAKNG